MRHSTHSNAFPILVSLIFFFMALPYLPADESVIPAPNFITNPNFSAVGADPLKGWTQLNPADSATQSADNSSPVLSVTVNDNAGKSGVEQRIPVLGEWAKVLLRGEIRVDFHGGSKSSFVGIQVSFVDKSGQITLADGLQSWLTTTSGWTEINELIAVPPGSVAMILAPEVDGCDAHALFQGLSLVAWVQTFEDHFPGNTVDPTKWNVYDGKHDANPGEQEWFLPDAVMVSGNMLTITASHKQVNERPYESGQISTMGKFQQLYGLFEFQMKLPVTQGAWPATYLLPWDNDWPPEIDISELAGDDAGEVLQTNHYSDDYGRHLQDNLNFSADGLDRTQWHTYSLVWEPGSVSWYLDNVFRGSCGLPDSGVSDVPMYVNINLAIGDYSGDPSMSTWPQTYCCRQVSIYQRNDLPLPVYAENSPEITLSANTATLSAITCNPLTPFDRKWVLVDGPGTASIDHPEMATTKVTLRVPGMYHFRFTIANGKSSGVDDLLVYINNAIKK